MFPRSDTDARSRAEQALQDTLIAPPPTGMPVPSPEPTLDFPDPPAALRGPAFASRPAAQSNAAATSAVGDTQDLVPATMPPASLHPNLLGADAPHHFIERLLAERDAQLVGELSLRDTAREALRARLIHAGRPRERRSAYEIVFLMLAFASMVLLAAPPLVRVIDALHGS